MSGKELQVFQGQLAAHAGSLLDCVKMLKGVVDDEQEEWDDATGMRLIRLEHASQRAAETIANATAGFYSDTELMRLKKLEAIAPTMWRLLERCESYLHEHAPEEELRGDISLLQYNYREECKK